MSMYVGSRGGVGLPIPFEAFAGRFCNRCMLWIVDGELQDGDGVAAGGVLCGVRVDALLCQCYIAELIAAAVADGHMYAVAQVVPDGESQHSDGVAAGGGLSGVGVYARHVQCPVAELIAAAVADGHMYAVPQVVPDGELQDGDGVAAGGGLSGVGVGARHVQCPASELIAAAVADVHMYAVPQVVLDGELQDGDGVAAGGGLCGVGVYACLCQCYIAELIAAAVAEGHMYAVAQIVPDGEVEHSDGVAAGGGLSGVRVYARHVQYPAAELIAAAMADGHVYAVPQVVLDGEV